MDYYRPDPALNELDYPALFSLAEYHTRQSEIILSLARKKQAKEDEKIETENRANELQESYKIVMRCLRRGMKLDEAIEETSKIIHAPKHTIEIRWNDFISDTTVKNNRKKHVLIRDLSAIGISNVQIAHKLGLHPVTISRILSKERKNWRVV